MSSRWRACRVLAAVSVHQLVLTLSRAEREAADQAPTCEAAPSRADFSSVLLQTQHFRDKRETLSFGTLGTESLRKSSGEHGQVPASSGVSVAVQLRPWHNQLSSISQGPPILAPPGWKPQHMSQAAGHSLLALKSPRVQGPPFLSHRGWRQLPDVSMLQTSREGKPHAGSNHTPSKKQHKDDVPKNQRRSGKPLALDKESLKSDRKMLASKPRGRATKESKSKRAELPSEGTKRSKRSPSSATRINAKNSKGPKALKAASRPAAHSHKGGRASEKDAGHVRSATKGHLKLPKMNSTALSLKRMQTEKKVADEKLSRHGKANKRSFAEAMRQRLSMVSGMVSMMVLPVSCFMLVTGCLMVYTIDADES